MNLIKIRNTTINLDTVNVISVLNESIVFQFGVEDYNYIKINKKGNEKVIEYLARKSHIIK